MPISYLFGIRDVGNEDDFAKIRNYGFFYYFSTPDEDNIKELLNNILFYTLQEVTLDDLPMETGTRATYANLKISQPIPGSIGETITVRYIPLINTEEVVDVANKAFLRWMYHSATDITRGFLAKSINPLDWTAEVGYVLLSPDLEEIWGGELFSGVVLEQYNHNYALDTSRADIRTIDLTFRFIERWPILTVIRDGSPRIRQDLYDFVEQIREQAKSVFDNSD